MTKEAQAVAAVERIGYDLEAEEYILYLEDVIEELKDRTKAAEDMYDS